MDDLPELPFEQILSYLNLEDRLKSRAVSKVWRKRFDFKAKSLCYSDRPIGFIEGKSRWVSGAFVRNFISSSRFASFFNTFGQTIFSNLKHLRLCDLQLSQKERKAFARTLQSFGQLEELDLIRFAFLQAGSNQREFELTLPMLNNIHLEQVYGMKKLTLDAPRLSEIKRSACSSDLNLDLVHGESVERLVIDQLSCTEVKKLKNLKVLKYHNSNDCSIIDSTFVSDLEQLKEIHLVRLRNRYLFWHLFEQKRRSGRAELKIYLLGLLLSGPDDPAINNFNLFGTEALRYWTENASRLADEIPLHDFLCYTSIERVAPDSELNIVKRFTDLKGILVDRPVRNVQHFLDLLKNFDNKLEFFCDQKQDLFDRLPEHCAVQNLTIESAPSNFRFLFRLKHLVRLNLDCSINAKTIRKAFEELQFLSFFEFHYNDKKVKIKTGHSKQFEISVDGKRANVADLNAAIQLILENAPLKKRRAKVFLE